MSLDLSPALPEKVTVYYPGRRCAGQANNVVPLWYSRDAKLADINFTDTDVADDFTGVPSSVLIIHDACQALFDPDLSDPTNKDALVALAKQIAQDFYDFRSFSFDFVYQGICAIEPLALYDYIEFIYDADEPGMDDYDRVEAIEHRLRPNFSTRVISEPWNGEVQEMQHMDPEVGYCTDGNNDGDPVEVVPCITYYEGTYNCVGGGALATAYVDENDGFIDSIDIDDGGTYSSVPTVIISGDGTGAKLTAQMSSDGTQVIGVNIDEAGQDYTTAIISFKGGGSKLQLVRRKLCYEDGKLVSTFISYDTIV